MINVTMDVSLNNLISVDEVTNTASFDFFLRLSWYDNRLYMPALFRSVNSFPGIIEVTPAMGESNIFGATTGLWLPDIIFPDAQELYSSDQFVRIYSNGGVMWIQHIIITVLQSNFDYSQYPTDSQHIFLNIYSFSLYSFQIAFTPVTIGYMYSSNGNDAISLNPLWSFDGAVSSNGNDIPGTSYNSRSYALVDMQFSRKSSGIILRLAIPIFLLVFLGALSFWADIGDRVNSTVTMLLAISALYIVVIQNIPMVGYLTNFDLFVTVMFSVLFSCCILHLLTVRLSKLEKVQKWPLRMLYIRLLEMFGRVCIIPIIISCFFYDFRGNYTLSTIFKISFSVSIFVIFVAMREYISLASTFREVILDINGKCDQLSDLSIVEILIFNVMTYGVVSTTIHHHLRVVGNNDRLNQTYGIKDDHMTVQANHSIIVNNSVYSDEHKCEFESMNPMNQVEMSNCNTKRANGCGEGNV